MFSCFSFPSTWLTASIATRSVARNVTLWGTPGQTRSMALVSSSLEFMCLSLICPIQYPLARIVTCQRSLKHSLGLHSACVRFLSPTYTPPHSWSITVTLYLIFVIALASSSVAMGRYDIWRDDVRELPWFGQAPGYPGVGYASYSSRYGNREYPTGGSYPTSGSYAQYPTTYPGNVVQQQAGHSLVIQPGMNGGAPTVQQIPM